MIVSDASPLISLSRVGRLELLRILHGTAAVPPAVHREVVTEGKRRGRPDALAVEAAVGKWIEVRPVPPRFARSAAALRTEGRLGRGEAESIALAVALRAPLLMDDRAAVAVARRHGVATTWSTSLVLEAVVGGKLLRNEGRRIVEDLVTAGHHIAPGVLVELLRELSE